MCDCSDGPEFFEWSRPKARKEHRCCECKRTIRVGETYERASGKWDGDFRTFATCKDCLDAWAAIDSECRCFGGLVDEISEGPWSEYKHWSGARMTLPLIRVVERYRAYWRQKQKVTALSTRT